MRNALLCTAVAFGGALVVSGFGCSSSSSPATSNDGGSKDSAVATDTGTPTGDSGGGGGDAGAACVGGGPTAPDLYHRLGCEAGITMAVSAIAGAALNNMDIASYFAYAGLKDSSGYTHPTPAQIEACLVAFLSMEVGGPDTYPTTVTGGFQCRSMSAAHADLYISGGSFDTFVAAAASVLMGAPFNVAATDLMTIGGALTSLKPQIVNPLLADAGLETLTQGIQEADASEQ
jgi:hypothetical protein